VAAKELGFKAEVQQLLQLMIRSVYSDREVFLRELISNAADALDKVRFLELTEKDLVEAAGESGIRIHLDEEGKLLTIEDDGIGMSEEEVVQNLGTIAHSGSRAFLEQLEKNSEESDIPSLIGQFGVGFYSAFMVAEDVVVETRSARADSVPVRWTSKGEGSYTVEEGSRETRGTSIQIHLREDSLDFAKDYMIKGIVTKHSNFLPWPIWIGEEQANNGTALWTKRPSEVTDEEANSFYRSVATDFQDPAIRVHVSVDSPIQYNALLFIPQERPYDLFQPEAERGPRLYAKRVLIEEHARGLMPDWLRFVRGVVDSEDIPLNVSREMVQKTPVIRKIRDALTRRVLKRLAEFAKADVPETSDEEEAVAPPTYDKFWTNFGVCLKEAYYHEQQNWGEKLLPLFRFNALSHDDATGLLSLESYKENMAEGQDTIWFLAGESRENCLNSPHLEAIRNRGWDVLFMTDSVDEWLMSALTEYEGIEIKSVSRGEIELEEEESSEDKADLTGIIPWMGELLNEQVAQVRASSRLTDSACVLVDDEAGMSANLERILRAANQDVVGGRKRILELNPKHPIIRNIATLHADGKTDAAQPLVELLYDDALLLEGTVLEPAAMGRRLQALLERASAAALTAQA
jgi:molecular chaperone HtpG